MHSFDTVILERVERVKDDRIRPLIDTRVGGLDVEAWQVPGEPVPPAEALAAPYRPVTLPHRWGAAWSTWWFRLSGTVPEIVVAGQLRLDVDLGFADAWPGNQCEGLLFTPDLRVLKAINSRNRSCVIEALPGQQVSFLIEAAANPDLFADGCRATPLGDVLTAPKDPIYTLRSAEFRVRDETLWGLFHDLDLLWDLARRMPEGSTRRAVICRHLECAMDVLDLHDVAGSAQASRDALAPVWDAPAVASRWRSPQSGTPTSTRPGCGRYARPSARSPGRSATSSPWLASTRTSGSPRPAPSSTPGCRNATRRSSRRSAGRSGTGSGSPPGACGWNPMSTCRAARP